MKKWRLCVLAVISFNLIVKLTGQSIPKCSELFFSEYVEGSRNNKGLEIFNPTNKDIQLSSYRIVRWQNGSQQFSSVFSQKLKGIIKAHKTIVIVIDKQDTLKTGADTPVIESLRKKADLFLGNTDSFNFTMSFNGNDAISLEKYNAQLKKYVAIDIIGKIGENPDPCWSDKSPFTGKGNWYTMDRTLIRKSTITHGIDTVVDGVLMAKNPSVFNPTLEWISYPRDMFDSLRNHSCNCENLMNKDPQLLAVTVYPNPFTENVKITSSNALKKISIFSIEGVEIKLISFNNLGNPIPSEFNFDGSAFVTGCYLLQIENQLNEKFIVKLIKN